MHHREDIYVNNRVFISHSSTDTPFCERLADALRGVGFDVWIDRTKLKSGPLLSTIVEALKHSPIFIVVLSPEALSSKWVEDECQWAYHHYRHTSNQDVQVILPVVAKTIRPEDVWTFLAQFKRIEAGNGVAYPEDGAIRQTIQSLQSASQDRITEQPSPPGPKSGNNIRQKIAIAITLIIVGLIGIGGFVYTHSSKSPPQPQMKVSLSTPAAVAPQSALPITVTAKCPSGTSLVSGGYNITDASNPGGDYFPQENHPALDGTGWVVSYLNTSSDQQNITAQANCVANAGLHTQVLQTENFDASNRAQIPCPSGMIATSGGYNFASEATFATTSAPFSIVQDASQQGWLIETQGNISSGKRQAYVECVTGPLTLLTGKPATFIVLHTISQNIHIIPVDVACSSGMLVGSGYILADQGSVQNIFILMDALQQQPPVWHMTLTNFSGLDQSGEAWPLCATFHSS
jgi:hypothetical protein